MLRFLFIVVLIIVILKLFGVFASLLSDTISLVFNYAGPILLILLLVLILRKR